MARSGMRERSRASSQEKNSPHAIHSYRHIDVQPGDFIQYFEKMADRTGHAVKCPDHNDVESTAASIGLKPIKSGSF